jgi:hypothetical protein
LTRPLHSRAQRVRQDILIRVADYFRAWAQGDDLATAELHNAIDSLLEDEFATERRQTNSDIRPNDE